MEKVRFDDRWIGPSLDHAVWFHHPARLDDWVLVDLLPGASAGARGFYTGTVHDRDGRLVATIAQEHVMRPGEFK
jgi:acyl-CoA thioesterase-2